MFYNNLYVKIRVRLFQCAIFLGQMKILYETIPYKQDCTSDKHSTFSIKSSILEIQAQDVEEIKVG
jgi:hypothetical protein